MMYYIRICILCIIFICVCIYIICNLCNHMCKDHIIYIYIYIHVYIYIYIYTCYLYTYRIILYICVCVLYLQYYQLLQPAILRYKGEPTLASWVVWSLLPFAFADYLDTWIVFFCLWRCLHWNVAPERNHTESKYIKIPHMPKSTWGQDFRIGVRRPKSSRTAGYWWPRSHNSNITRIFCSKMMKHRNNVDKSES